MTTTKPTNPVVQVAQLLNDRRRELGMSMQVVAERTGLPLRTVQRVLSAKEAPRLSTLMLLAEGLETELHLAPRRPAMEVRKEQAERKASVLIGMVQGTSALEAQAVPIDVRERVREETVYQLMAGSPRRLWAS